MYHELELPGRPLCQNDPGYVRYIISADEFARQMRSVRELGMCGVSVSNALDFTEAAVAITFDDGSETDLLSAAPVLKECGFGATFYIVSGFIGKRGYLSTAQLRELRSLGFEIGCHSMTHPYLTDLDEAGLKREIGDAKTALEQMIGERIEHFSCPGGRYDRRAMQVAKAAGFQTVSTSAPRVNTQATDKFSLGRIAITRDTSAAEFQQLCRGQALWKMNLRSGIRNSAKRVLGNTAYDRVRALLLK